MPLLGALLAAGCGGDQRPDPVPLSAGYEVPPLEAGPWRLPAEGWPGWSLEPLGSGDGVTAVLDTPLEAWERGPLDGVWVLPLPVPLLRPTDAVLLLDDVEAPRFPLGQALPSPAEVEANRGRWLAAGSQIWLSAPEPPQRAQVRLTLPLGELGPFGWRLRLPQLSANGIPLTMGQPRRIDFAPSAVERELRVATWSAANAEVADGQPVTFRFDVDGREAARFEQAATFVGSRTTRCIEIPAGARSVTLTVDGPPCLAAAIDPWIDVPRARSDDTRPDIVVFLADTLRADMLAAYRDDDPGAGPMPGVDALAARSRVYLGARSNAPWTLPSQASLLTGLPPLGHGAINSGRSLPDALPRLAALLQEAGYRTAAVTEGVYVSADYGLDRGFAVFDERSRSVERTVETALAELRDDDPRPLLLYVQSYRAHAPYHAGPDGPLPDVAARLRPGLGPRLRDAALLDPSLDPRGLDEAGLAGVFRGVVERDWDLYVASAKALDSALAPLWSALDERAVPTFTVFTSDHGEEFGEHDGASHGHALWEELIRIPLFIHGPDIAPGFDPTTVSLLDLTPTIASWAGVEPDPRWVGVPLGGASAGSAAFAWACTSAEHPESRAIVAGVDKWIEWDEPQRLQHFDLELDPNEWAPTPVESPSPTLEALQARQRALSVPPAVAPRRAVLGPEARARLRALGYAADED
ncbi:sulfatase-like hydrolase/transferase [Engelhardtia mirabilis]|uniref:sulfatase-like hydrolase/transferase n=1 Tax=Engelhardtia mirabilis TaxID=2528011 RepID=UPI003AF40905